MNQLYIFNFDGTSNSPIDAQQDVDPKGQIEDDSISNIVKFHLLCGGSLAQQGLSWVPAHQHCYYYAGIGSYGSKLQRIINTIFFPDNSDVGTILNRAMADFSELSFDDSNDVILVTGFSRGAALARRFAKLVGDKVTRPCIYEAVFDTVASINRPDIDAETLPKTEVVFENHSLPANVVQALHLLALDEKRSAFQPTLMNQEAKVSEIWFAGAHSDVGGGYYKDGLSDTAMRYFLNWLHELNIGLETRSAHAVNYHDILPDGVDYEISLDDVTVNPNPLGVSHEQHSWFPISLFTLHDRQCCTIEDEKLSKHLPKVHWSVAKRIYCNPDYRPQSLKKVRHDIVYQDNQCVTCFGIRDHIELPHRNITLLQKGESKLITVYAAEKYNRTGLLLQAGRTYSFHVNEGEHWRDGSIECDASGWDRAGVKLGLQEIPIAAMEPFRRMPEAQWFELCAAIDCTDKDVFRIGKESTHTMKLSGEFCPFANDIERFYGNNQGKISCLVTCLY